MNFSYFLLTSIKYRKVAMNFVQQFYTGRIARPDQGDLHNTFDDYHRDFFNDFLGRSLHFSAEG